MNDFWIRREKAESFMAFAEPNGINVPGAFHEMSRKTSKAPGASPLELPKSDFFRCLIGLRNHGKPEFVLVVWITIVVDQDFFAGGNVAQRHNVNFAFVIAFDVVRIGCV